MAVLKVLLNEKDNLNALLVQWIRMTAFEAEDEGSSPSRGAIYEKQNIQTEERKKV